MTKRDMFNLLNLAWGEPTPTPPKRQIPTVAAPAHSSTFVFATNPESGETVILEVPERDARGTLHFDQRYR